MAVFIKLDRFHSPSTFPSSVGIFFLCIVKAFMAHHVDVCVLLPVVFFPFENSSKWIMIWNVHFVSHTIYNKQYTVSVALTCFPIRKRADVYKVESGVENVQNIYFGWQIMLSTFSILFETGESVQCNNLLFATEAPRIKQEKWVCAMNMTAVKAVHYLLSARTEKNWDSQNRICFQRYSFLCITATNHRKCSVIYFFTVYFSRFCLGIAQQSRKYGFIETKNHTNDNNHGRKASSPSVVFMFMSFAIFLSFSRSEDVYTGNPYTLDFIDILVFVPGASYDKVKPE